MSGHLAVLCTRTEKTYKPAHIGGRQARNRTVGREWEVELESAVCAFLNRLKEKYIGIVEREVNARAREVRRDEEIIRVGSGRVRVASVD